MLERMKVRNNGVKGPRRGPVAEGLEDEFGAAVGVFFPAVELVVDGEGDAFFEFLFGLVRVGFELFALGVRVAVAGVGGEADDVALDLEAEGHVEVFGDGGFGPVFGGVGVGGLVGDVL